MAERERIIPIIMEADTESEGNYVSDSENKLSEPMEQLSIKTNETNNEKPVHKTNTHEEYLKEFDVFEDRSEYTLPNANVQEKIILVIDRAQDEHFTPFTADDSKFTPLSMLKRAIHIFINLKHSINKKHEFAVVLLNENDIKWVLNFTSDMKKLKDTVNKIERCVVEDTFNLNTLFEEIYEQVKLPEIIKPEIPPKYIIHTVIFYGRSYTIPTIHVNECVENLLESPYFICDVLITHEPVESSNHCHEIFKTLHDLDKKGISYFFPVCRDTTRLHNCTAKLLAHPLQRPLQKLQKI